MDFDLSQSLGYFHPELVVAATILAVAALDHLGGRRSAEALSALALVGVAASVYALAGQFGWGEGWIFGRWLVVDELAFFFKLLIALGAICVLWMAADSKELCGALEGRSYVLVLSATLGMFLMVSAASLTVAWLALELVALFVSRLARPGRRSLASRRGSFLQSAAASAAILCASAWVYGFAGSLDYVKIHDALRSAGGAEAGALTFALVLLLGGFALKILAVADREAPVPVTAFVAVCAKTAGLAVLVRFVYVALSEPAAFGVRRSLAGDEWSTLVAGASVAAMTFGNFAAARQRSLKRMLAFGSIAQLGYVLVGFADLGEQSLRWMLFYSMADCATALGAFLVTMIALGESEREDQAEMHGLARRGAFVTVTMSVFLLSLAAIPPFSGFVGRAPLIAAVAGHGRDVLLFAVLLNSLASLECSARVLTAMFLEPPAGKRRRLALDPYGRILAALLAAFTIAAGMQSAPFLDFAGRSIRFFQG